MDDTKRLELEQSVVARFIVDVVETGRFLRVWGGEDWAGEPSNRSPDLLAQCFSTDSDRLYIYPTEGATDYVGWVWFVYGNSPWEVLCDATANEITEHLTQGCEALMKQLEEKYA